MRGGFLMKRIRECIRAAHKPDFRIVELDVLGNHLHLIVEASGKVALARGVGGFWSRPLRIDAHWKQELVNMPRPNAKATTWLLTTGWKRLGLLRLDEAPA